MTDLLSKSVHEKYAILSMDVEDWYHLDYLINGQFDRSYSLLDGLDRYAAVLEEFKIPSSFFVLSDIAEKVKHELCELSQRGHDIGCHGDNHVRPLNIPIKDYHQRTIHARQRLEDLLGSSVSGYRAPCFSLDRKRLDLLMMAGFLYDSSKIAFGDHPLYGDLDVSGFNEVFPNIYRIGDFMEYEVSTLQLGNKRLPVSGGGYLRMFPWWLTSALMNRYLKSASLYVLYIHPFELSECAAPSFDASISLPSRIRFSLGRTTTEVKLKRIIRILQIQGFNFTTFDRLRKRLMEIPEHE